MSQPDCLCTGITLYSVDEGICKPADLFVFRDCFIVNAVGDGEVRSPRADERTISYWLDTPHFERRNVYVLPTWVHFLSPAAQDYINGAP